MLVAASRTALAISSFGALAIVCSPSRVTSVTSFSERRSRCRSGTRRCRRPNRRSCALSFSRARSRPVRRGRPRNPRAPGRAALRSPSVRRMSVVGSSSSVQVSSSFGRLARQRLGRAVVGRRGGHHTTSASARASASRELSSAVGVWTTSTPTGGGHREVRGEQRDLGAAAPGLRGDRDSHAPRRAVADEAHGVERLARAAGRRRPRACPARSPGCEQLARRAAKISSGSTIRPTPHSPSAVSPSSGPTARRRGRAASRRSPASPGATTCGGSSRARRARALGGRAPPRSPGCRRAPCGELRERVRGAAARHEQVGARQMRIEIVAGRPAARARGTSRGDEPLGARASRAERPRGPRGRSSRSQLARLVGGDASGDPEQDPRHGRHCARARSATNCSLSPTNAEDARRQGRAERRLPT